MFTGIIHDMGRIQQRVEKHDGIEFCVAARDTAERLSKGHSVAVNGVCHTVESVTGDTFTFTSVGETLRRTTLGKILPAARVNLEPAATADTALGGHLVQGHVDGVGRVEAMEEGGMDRLLTIRLPAKIFAYMVSKGSVAVDGVSLTVVETKPDNCITITIIPFTMENTIIGGYRVGTSVNIEIDIVGKYVREYLMRIVGGDDRRWGELSTPA
jgi:riboflavin synthase